MAPPSAGFDFLLNGLPIRVSGVAPQVTLLDFVRSHGLTGAKEGCAEGECGACAVLLVTSGKNGTIYQAVNSCLVPLPSIADSEVLTVESLAAPDGLAEVQQAMVEHGGSQCGYCTPGFVVSMFAEQYATPGSQPDNPRDPHALGGNLCRCTGYRPIRDAFQSVGAPRAGKLLERLKEPAPRLQSLAYEASSGRFSRPRTLKDCLEIVAADPAARLVAGNTDLGVVTNLRGERFSHLVSLEAIDELKEFHETADFVEIGAGLSLTEIGERWDDAPHVFREWLALFASPLIRNRATLGGNLATASPIGDAAPMLLGLDAEVTIAGYHDERSTPLDSFFRGYRQTAIESGEILRSIRIPKPYPGNLRFYKIAKRRLDDISTVAAAIAVDRDTSGRIRAARIAFGGVAAVPIRARGAENALQNTFGHDADLARAIDALRRVLDPISDHRGSAAYRAALAESLLEKFWFEEFAPVNA